MRRIVEKSMLGKAWVALNDSITDTDDDLINNILKSRGIVEKEDIEKFLNPSWKLCMPDPFVLQDMEKAIKIIADSVCNHEKIAIYGDYDVDGITSTAVFVKYLREAGVDVCWHLPKREGEGYGLNIAAIDELAQSGVDLLISVDCGISGIQEVKHAKELGLKVVITDHHSPDNVLPEADAVVNPKRQDDTSGLNYLAGVGVAFMTLVALNRELRTRKIFEKDLRHYLDLVALGTICDTMPLIGLNRLLVKKGLEVMARSDANLGIRTLMKEARAKLTTYPVKDGKEKESATVYTAGFVLGPRLNSTCEKPVESETMYTAGFVLGPRLNAAGRLASAEPALELLLTDSPDVAERLAQQLDAQNTERIEKQAEVMRDATYEANECCKNGKCSIFVCGKNWPGGVMGIVAGRLKDKYNKPICVATEVDGVINGSGRSVSNIDLGKIIHEALALGILTEGGGHAAAAGFTLNADKEKEFCEFLERSVKEQLSNSKPEEVVFVDIERDASGANMNLFKSLSVLAPFGQGNPEPTIVLNGATLKYVRFKGSGNTIISGRVRTANNTELSFVAFNAIGTAIGDFLQDEENTNTPIKMLGKLKENEYNGGKQVQFILEDIAL